MSCAQSLAEELTAEHAWKKHVMTLASKVKETKKKKALLRQEFALLVEATKAQIKKAKESGN